MTRHKWKAEMERGAAGGGSPKEKERGEARKQVDKTDYIYIDRKIFARISRAQGYTLQLIAIVIILIHKRQPP